MLVANRSGFFKDNAGNLIEAAIPAPLRQQDSALARALAHAASLGVDGDG